MNLKLDVAAAMAKLSGIQQSLVSILNENIARPGGRIQERVRSSFAPADVEHYFTGAVAQLDILRSALPHLYDDFQDIRTQPCVEMAPLQGRPLGNFFSRFQVERLARDILQIFEIRANSELAPPTPDAPRRVFLTHGRSNDWRAVQAFIEKDVKLRTLELEQEPNLGRTVIEKLCDNSALCDSAVIVMTGDDVANVGEARVRENVMHEIGLFQGRYGRDRVVLLHEEGVNIPTNLGGVVYAPFPKGTIEASYVVLQRELKAIYRL